MRICIIVRTFLPKWVAGTELASYNIAKELAQNGHEVHVITAMADDGVQYERMGMIDVHRHPVSDTRVFGIALFWLRISLQLLSISPDIVLVQSILMGVPAVVARGAKRIPYVVWAQGSDVYRPWNGKSVLTNLIVKQSALNIALTQDMKTSIESSVLGSCSQIVVLPNGVDFQLYSEYATESHTIPDKGPVQLVSVGNLRPEKGQAYLIDAVHLLRERGLSVVLTIIGEGACRPYLEGLIASRGLKDVVRLAGNVPNREIPGYLSHSHIFILSSVSEGFPLVLLEAMASGLPIVASRIGGISEIISSEENGLLVEPENPGEIADAIELLIQNRARVEEMSQKNRKKASLYSWTHVANQLEYTIQRIVEKQRSVDFSANSS